MAEKNDLLHYLARSAVDRTPIPSIIELSQELGISTASVREQLEVARRMGVVEVRPKVGIQLRSFSLNEPLSTALTYGIAVDDTVFDQLADLRKHLESSYWYEAVPLLTSQDIRQLQTLVDQAIARVHAKPMQSPENEHRRFHLAIFKRLENPAVISLMEAYWDAYQKIGMTRLMDFGYLEAVWRHHQGIVDALKEREFEKGHQVLLAHMDLVKQVRKPGIKNRFE